MTMTAREARKRFSEMLDQVQRGQSVTITRRGRKVAQLGPVPNAKGRTLPDLTEFRRSLGIKPQRTSIRDLRRAERY